MAYNGYTNYETWCVHLHMTNNEADNFYWEEVTRECMQDGEEAYELSLRLKDEFTEALSNSCVVPGVFGDLLRAAVSEVNWLEIARHYITSLETA